MRQFLGLGDGSDGVVTDPALDTPIDSTCSGTSGTKSLSATNASFAAGQIILIYQTQGSGAGSWELNRINSYVAGAITTVYTLENTYGVGAQVIVFKQYSLVTISTGVTSKAWNGSVGGVAGFLCRGILNIATNNISVTGLGFRGGAGSGNNNIKGNSGEGTPGPSVSRSNSRNGNGGGGGNGNGQYPGAPGANAGDATTHDPPQEPGSSVGSADLTNACFGGGGGGDSEDGGADSGGTGAGWILIFADTIKGSGGLLANGNAPASPHNIKAGGPGAGGSILLKCRNWQGNSLTITASAGTDGAGTGSATVGRIRIEACNAISITTSPVASTSVGGFSFCQVISSIF